MLIRVGLDHLADTNFGGADGRLSRGHVAISADLGDIAERTAFLLVAGDDRDQDLVLVDLLAGLLAVLHEHRAFRGKGVGILRDGEQFLILNQVILLLVETAHFVLESLDFNTGLFHERVGHHQTVVFAVLLD